MYGCNLYLLKIINRKPGKKWASMYDTGAAKTLKNRVVVTILNIRIVQKLAKKSVELG